MKQLGGVSLPNSMRWIDQFGWSPVAMATDRTLGGGLVSWSMPLQKGRLITLEAQHPYAWVEKAVVIAIQSMAAEAGSVFLLIWDDEVFNVMFHHSTPPAMEFKPVRPGLELFYGTVKLIEV